MKDCKHEVLLSFSCKGRYFCPSCHQKRIMFGEWITEEILYPLPHRQHVFTLPKVLRSYFRFDRKLLGKLSQCAYQSLKEFAPVRVFDLDQPGTGDVTNSFVSYDREMNKELIRKSYQGTPFLAGAPESEIDSTAKHPEAFFCTK